jgi:uncharacterized protein (DUF1499 family)
MFSGTPPAGLGVCDGRLQPCPSTPNCVSSQECGSQRVAPLAFTGAPETALARLVSILSDLARVRIVQRSAHYVRAEAASRLFGFVDDVEFVLDPDAGVIHVRSCARLGYSDFGVNRRRVEAIRARFAGSAPAR